MPMQRTCTWSPMPNDQEIPEIVDLQLARLPGVEVAGTLRVGTIGGKGAKQWTSMLTESRSRGRQVDRFGVVGGPTMAHVVWMRIDHGR